MKNNEIKKIVSVACALTVLAGFAACGKEDKTPETSLPAETTEPSGEHETTATPTASVTVTESSQTNNTNNTNSSNNYYN